MPRMTRKYEAALRTIHRLRLPQHGDANSVYGDLEDIGYHWNSQIGEWEKWADQPADEPTDLIMIRLWCATEVIAELAEDVTRQMGNIGLRLVEASPPYQCRPPKQQESRVYLKFFPERKLK